MTFRKVLMPLTNIRCEEEGCDNQATHIIFEEDFLEGEEIENGTISEEIANDLSLDDIYFWGCKEHATKYLGRRWGEKKGSHLVINPTLCQVEED